MGTPDRVPLRVSMSSSNERTSDAPWARDLLLLVLAFGGLLLAGLGRAPLANPDEGRYAEVPREMIASGDYVTPRLDGVPYFEKPPLGYWMVAACERWLGPGEAAVRLTPAALALAGILMTYAAARRLHGRDAGLWSAGVLGTSLLFFGLGHLVTLDMPVSVLMTSTLLCFILAVHEPPGTRRRLLFYGLYASSALATLTKGLEGFLITGAVMFLWLVLYGQWHRLRPLHLPTGILLFLAIALPWHLLAAARNPGWARFYFIHEHWERFTDTGHGRYQPPWFFIPVLLLGLFPWTGFLWPALREAVAGGWAGRRDRALPGFFLVWAGFILLFFSASKSKLIPYILPVFPALAVLVGGWVARALPGPGAFARLRAGFVGFGALSLLLAAALCVAALKAGIIHDPAQAQEVRPYALILAAFLLVGGLRAMVPRGGDDAARGAFVAMTVAVLAMFGVLLLARPAIDQRSSRDVALEARAALKPGDQVFHYHGFFHDFTYYTGTLVGLVNYQDELELGFLGDDERKARFVDDAGFRRVWEGPARVLLVARNRDAGPLMNDRTFRFHILAVGAHYTLFSNQP